MTATLICKNLSAEFGERQLFSGLDLVVSPGDVIGLVGANGAGKSTLLAILSGSRVPSSGSVTTSPSGATIGHLLQETERVPGESVRSHLSRRTGVTDATKALDDASDALAREEAGADDLYAESLERWLSLGGADIDDRAAAVAADLGLTVDLDSDMSTLSGGQAARVGLAALLLSRHDIVLLDEPTNNLDIDGLDRLERYVKGLRSGVVVVSHDREFLARTVTSVVELDLAQQQVNVYGGGYAGYLEEREIARRHAREAFDAYADTLGSLQERARMQRAWMDKGVRNARRKATDNDKHIKNFRGETSEKQAAKAGQTDRAIERLEVIDEPRKEWELSMSIAMAPRSGAMVATLSGAVVSRGSFTLGPIDVALDWADRVVITGANGSGKSTLIALLLGRLQPDLGTAALGSSTVVGEVDQARALFAGDQPLTSAFGIEVPDWPDAEVRTLLAKFGLRAAHVTRPCRSLTAGERTRAALALLQARGVNLLVLDEPTNHLDLPAIEQLEAALDSYDGTLLLVTHDRRMLDSVRFTRRWAMDAGRLSES